MALVHRDVSPSNVLLSRAGEVKLTDFGIAKRAESDATQGGAVRGKFAYISPEQARNEPLDPRSDVFSVGILMWELCCNRRLFSGLDDLAALRAVRDPSTIKRPSEIDPRLPPELDQLLMTALARDRKQRFSGCGVLGQKLRSLRYSLEETSGDPATELAKIIDSTEEVERQSKQMIAPLPPSGRNDFDGGEATVIRIHTADAFSARDEGKSISQARQVIDKFEEEETRLASLSGDQLRMLRSGAQRDSVEMTAEKPRLDRSAAKRSRRDSGIDDDEMTRAREPLDLGRSTGGPKRELYDSPFETPAGATLPGDESSGPSYTPSDPGYAASIDTPPHQRLTPTDDTRLHRRTPLPQRVVRPQGRPPTVPPPVPERTRAPSQGAPRQNVATPLPMPQMQPPPNMGQPLQMAQPSIPQPLQPYAMTPVPQQPMLPTGPAMPHIATPMPQQPGMPQPGQPMPPHLVQPQFMPSQNAGAYPNQGWGPPIAAQMPPREATPTAPDQYDQRAMYPNRPSMPQVAGFTNRGTIKTRGGLKPWVLVVGALVMAALAFVITRAFIG
jgi:serine/threonine-protein kinase